MWDILKISSMRKLFIVAILLRLLIMPFYFHPDIKTYNFQSSFLKQGVLNIYTYLDNNKEKLPLKEEFVYFPLTYFFLGGYQILASPFLGGNFYNWISDASASATTELGVFRYLFILKIPYLILDIFLGLLLTQFFTSIEDKKKALVYWLFNPISFAVIYIFSNVDIFPVLISLFSLLLFQRKKYYLSFLILGISIGFKAYTILFLPFLLLFIKNRRQQILALGVLISVVSLIIIPFLSGGFIHSAVLSSLTTRLIFPSIGIGFGESLMIGIISLTVLFFVSLSRKNENTNKCWLYLLVLLLLVFSTIHYHIQWLLWIMPFIVVISVLHSNLFKLIWLWAYLACLIPLLYDDKSMSISLLSAVSPLYNLLPTPFLVASHIYDPYLLQGMIHSLLFGIALVVVWKGFQYD